MSMREEDLARVLLVQACESSDPEGRFLPSAERERASRQAARDVPDDAAQEATIVARAEALSTVVEPHRPALARARRAASARIGLPVVLLIGLGIGLAADSLGSARRINLLSFPLLTLVAWNLAVYAGSGLFALVRGFSSARTPHRSGEWLGRLASWWAAPRRFMPHAPSADELRWQLEASHDFFSLWTRHAGALLAARWRRVLHTAAASLALGIVVGMYVQGFAFAYEASWESTFLSADGVRALLGVVLGPAAALLGFSLPDVATVARLESPGSGPAAAWIHLWAVTAGLAIVAPRSLLALLAWRSERRASARLGIDVQDPHWLKVLAPGRGEGRAVTVQPYSFQPSKASQESLRELLLELFGNRARLSVLDPLPYGAAFSGSPEDASSCEVLVFNLAQSPEQEVHGELLEDLKHRVEARDGSMLLVLLDREAYLARASEGGEGEERLLERVAERRRTWERVLRECGLEAAAVGGGAIDESTLGAARAALWPSERAAI